MENYDFHYKHKFSLLNCIWLGITIFTIIFNLLMMRFEDYNFFHMNNIIYLIITLLIIVINVAWLIYVEVNSNQAIEGKIVYTYSNKNTFRISYRIEYVQDGEKKQIETIKIWKPFYNGKKYFYEKNKFVNCPISFKLSKKKHVAYPIHIEEPEDTNEYLDYID